MPGNLLVNNTYKLNKISNLRLELSAIHFSLQKHVFIKYDDMHTFFTRFKQDILHHLSNSHTNPKGVNGESQTKLRVVK